MEGEQVGRVAVVTGASYGLGRAIAQDLCKRGAKVLLTDISDRVVGTAEELAAMGFDVAQTKMDVTDRASVKAGVAEAIGRFGPIDVFVNNAGWSKSMNLIRDIAVDEWQTYMDINVRGNLHCIQEAADAMIAGGRGGRFIAIASTAAVKPYLRAASYCTSKSAIHMLIKSAALEFGKDGITFNVVSPGPSTTETNLAHGAGNIDPAMGEAKRKREAMIPLGKNDPEDIATAVAWFASPEAKRVTGQMMVVEGGGQLIS